MAHKENKMETSNKRFKIKVGYCYLYPDKIILARDGSVENINFNKEESLLWKRLIYYAIIAVLFIRQAILSYEDLPVASAMLAIFGIYLVWAIFSSLNNSSTALIERKQIRSVVFKKSVNFITRSYFKIYFKDKNGKIKKRLILLPGSLNDGEEATQTALKLMEEMGYYNSENQPKDA